MDPNDFDSSLDVTPLPWNHEDVKPFHEKLKRGDDPEKILEDQIAVIERLDAKRALKRLTIADIINSLITNVDIPDDGAGLPPKLHNYLIGLIFVHGTKAGKGDCSYEELAGPILDIGYKCIFSDDPDPDAAEDEKLESMVEHALKEQAFTAGQWTYSEQHTEASIRAYEPHDEYLKDMWGFTIEEANECSQFIEDLFAERRMELVDLEFTKYIEEMSIPGHSIDAHIQQHDKTGSYDISSDGFDFQKDAYFIELIYQKSKSVEDAFFVSHDEILRRCPSNIEKQVLVDFLERMSDELGNVQSNPGYRWPYQFNPLSKTPLIRIDGEYFTPNGDLIRKSLMDSFYYDLINLKEYGNPGGNHGGEFGRLYGDYLEDWTVDCFSRLYPDTSIYPNLLYPNDLEEACDVLIEGSSTLFVVECKVGKIPKHLRNKDFETIQEEINTKIGDGYKRQALPLIKELRDGIRTQLVYNGKLVELSKYSDYRPIIVVGEPYDALSTHLIDVIIDNSDVSPYVIDIFTLQVITEFFSSPRFFENYIRDRMKLFDNKVIMSPDEIDYVGLYYLNGYEFPEVGDNQLMMIGDMGDVIGEEIDYEFGG